MISSKATKPTIMYIRGLPFTQVIETADEKPADFKSNNHEKQHKKIHK